MIGLMPLYDTRGLRGVKVRFESKLYLTHREIVHWNSAREENCIFW